MTWEHVPGRSGARRWLPLAATTVVVGVLLVAIADLDPRPAVNADPLSIDARTGAVSAAAAGVSPVDPASFVARALPPVTSWTRPRAGASILPGTVHGLAIIATDHLGVWTADVARGRVRRLRTPAGGIPAGGGGLWVSGDTIVFDTHASVLQLLGDPPRLQTLATGHRSIHTVGDDGLWVFDGTSQSSGGTASRVALDGEVLDQVSVPAGATPLSGTADDLLVNASGAIVRIAVDGSRSLIARGEAIASNGTQLAWVRCDGDLSCAVVLGTFDEPDRVRVPFPLTGMPVTQRFGRPVAAFSPDGRWLALPLYGTSRVDGGDALAIALIDVATGVEVHRATGPRSNLFESPLAWSPDSRWLVFGSDAGISAWRAGTRDTRTLDLGFSRARGLAVRSTGR